MKRKIIKMNTANRITISRIALVPFFILFLFILGKLGAVISLFIFIIASLSDWLDGYIARKGNSVTTMGKIMDPVADKILTLSAFICFVYLHIVPFWMVIIIMARDLVVMALRVELANRGCILTPNLVAKFKTVLEYAAVLFALIYLLTSPGFIRISLRISVYSTLGLAAFFAVVSGVQYLLEGRKILAK